MRLYENRRRRRRFASSKSPSKSAILLAEFMFYNKTKNVIDNTILKSLKDKLLNDNSSDTVYWSSEAFSEYSIGFKVIKKTEKINSKDVVNIYIEILEFPFKFKLSQLINLKYIFHMCMFINFELNSDQILFLRMITVQSSSIVNKENYLSQTFDTWQEIVDFLIVSKELNRYNYDCDVAEYDYNSLSNKITPIRDWNLLFPDSNIDKTDLDVDVHKDKHADESIYYIVKVFEKRINNRNYRSMLYKKIERYNTYIGVEIIDDTEQDYTLIDEKRIFFTDRLEGNKIKKYFLDTPLIEFNDKKQPIIYNDLYVAMMKNITQILPKNKNIITPSIYRFYQERVLKREYDNYESEITEKEKLILDRYIFLLNQDKEIKIGDVFISKTKIRIEGLTIKFDFEFINVVEKLIDLKQCMNIQNAQYNFNIIYENILKISNLKYISKNYTGVDELRNFKEVTFTLNNVTINIKRDNKRFYINGAFCRIDDILHILERGICFENTIDFNKYVKDVSYIGIEWKMMISNGINIQLSNPFYHIFEKTGYAVINEIYMRFSLLWDVSKRQTVYLLLNDKRYLIQYKGKFKKYFNYPNRVLSIGMLKKELQECLANLDDDIIIDIVENAIEEAKLIKKRGDELIKMTVKDINAKEETVDINGAKSVGYTFTGKKTGDKYFVDKINLSVWKIDNGAWNRRCIVDNASKQRIFEDKIANRLINIYNEPDYLANFLKT